MIPGLSPLTSAPAADTPRQRAAQQAGLGFERLLLGEMARTMTASAGLAGAAGILADQLPDVLADAVVAGGGIGLGALAGGDGPTGGSR